MLELFGRLSFKPVQGFVRRHDSGAGAIAQLHKRISSNSSGNPTTKQRWVASLLAILLGGYGIHHFYLGSKGWGILSAVFFWTGIPFLLSVIDVIALLTMSIERFDAKYNAGPVNAWVHVAFPLTEEEISAKGWKAKIRRHPVRTAFSGAMGLLIIGIIGVAATSPEVRAKWEAERLADREKVPAWKVFFGDAKNPKQYMIYTRIMKRDNGLREDGKAGRFWAIPLVSRDPQSPLYCGEDSSPSIIGRANEIVTNKKAPVPVAVRCKREQLNILYELKNGAYVAVTSPLSLYDFDGSIVVLPEEKYAK